LFNAEKSVASFLISFWLFCIKTISWIDFFLFGFELEYRSANLLMVPMKRAMKMKSPFSGADPYLEQHWGDIHTRLMVYINDQISDQLPQDLQARVEESVCVVFDESARRIYPDVAVIELPDIASSSAVADADAVIAEPTIIPVPREQTTLRHIEIVDLNGGYRVVTAIELLSPANKQEGSGRMRIR